MRSFLKHLGDLLVTRRNTALPSLDVLIVRHRSVALSCIRLANKSLLRTLRLKCLGNFAPVGKTFYKKFLSPQFLFLLNNI